MNNFQIQLLFLNHSYNKKVGVVHKSKGGDILKNKLLVSQVYKRTNFDTVDFHTTKDIEVLKEDIVDQKRAKNAIRFGLSIDKYGYNIFCSGNTSARKKTYLQSVLKEFAKKKLVPNDLCYIHNFENENNPILVSLPKGQGYIFKQKMDDFVDCLEDEIMKLFNTDKYKKTVELLIQKYENEFQKLYDEYDEKMKPFNYTLVESHNGIVPAPMKDNKILSQEDFDGLSDAEKNEYIENKKKIDILTVEMIHKEEELNNQRGEELDDIDIKMVEEKVEELLKEVEDTFGSIDDKIAYFIDEIKSDIIDRIDSFRPSENGKNPFIAIANLNGKDDMDFLDYYLVNLIVDNKDLEEAPVIFVGENPEEHELFGGVTYNVSANCLTTNFLQIQAGDLIKANGGYIVIDVEELFKRPYLWYKLKECLKSKKIKLNSKLYHDVVISDTLNPEPIDLDVKVILIGNIIWYYLLMEYEPDFKELFKIHAIFESEMDRTLENELEYLRFIAKYCEKYNLKPFDREASAAIIEYAARLAENQNKLTLNYEDIYNLLNEADAWGSIMGKEVVDRECIEKAIEEKDNRVNVYNDIYRDYINTKTILLKTSGKEVGVINSLVVMNFGDYTIGRPSRITANTFKGKEGVISIDRNVKLSGKIHNKGVEIIKGFLGSLLSKKESLSLNANISFEQSYGGVDGDSATLAELCAILSDLSEVPIKQSIAITGSMNQKGEVQAIGGVNEKVEGFYAACKLQGLNGEQGVIIPSSNVHNLMLSPEVRKAIEEGKFSIYSVERIEEVVELLMDISFDKLIKIIEEKLNTYKDRDKE